MKKIILLASLCISLYSCGNPLGTSTTTGIYSPGATPGSSSSSGSSNGFSAAWTPQYSSIVGYWKLDGSGNITTGDSILATIGTNGTASNANAAGMNYSTGQLNQAISFDGTDDQVSLGGATPAGFPLGASARSISFWSKFNNLATNQTIFMYGNASNNNMFLVYVNNTMRIAFYGNDYDTGVAPVANNWEHWIVTLSGTVLTAYRNGAQVWQDAGIGPPNTTSGALNYIGRYNGGADWYMNGFIDEVALWSVALLPAEVTTIYNRQLLGN